MGNIANQVVKRGNNNKLQVSSTDRRNLVLQKKLAGETKQQIWEWYKKKYNKSIHSFDKDVSWCNNKMELFVDKTGSSIITDHLVKYDHIYKTALEFGQLSAANQALVNAEKLLKLHSDVGHTFVQNNNFNVEHLEMEQIKELLDKYDKED